jgi:alpha-mannosidase
MARRVAAEKPAPVVHLICNSHIDPVWLWEWEEGAAEGLATFRAAADFCDEFVDFIFCHNESILYEWTENYEPALFKRIQRLVKAGRWHIMGGWYLQADCNLPAGESFVRQILLGKRYFREKFGVDVQTAANLDAFGHTRGLVQILAKSGYKNYLYCRPDLTSEVAPGPEYWWVGYDGSKLFTTLGVAHYNSPPGGAADHVSTWVDGNRDKPISALMWGVGNHGGGPSRVDLKAIAKLRRETQSVSIVHSNPDAYAEAYLACDPDLPSHCADLNPFAVGCYTSMSRVKQLHRHLESELLVTEKMATNAAIQRLKPYPREALNAATRDLAWSEFHDSLTGTSIQAVEETLTRTLHHGLEELSRVKAELFFAFASGQKRAREGEFPILVYNPHPRAVTTVIECELQPQWPHKTSGFLQPVLFQGSRQLAVQAEKERCNINEDHRKRIAFSATLAPGKMNRFSCYLQMEAKPPKKRLKERNGKIRFRSERLNVVINCRTGLIDTYRVDGKQILAANAARPLVLKDDADPWGMRVKSFRRKAGAFRLLSQKESAEFAAVEAKRLTPVRVIEEGPVRVVVEALLKFRGSYICQQYILPREGTAIEIATRVYWLENDGMLKLSFPTGLANATYQGQVAYGVDELPSDGTEAVAHRWTAAVDQAKDVAFSCINEGTYGSDFSGGELRINLLRSPAYSGHPTAPGIPITKQDRHTPRMDQGERFYRFRIDGGSASEMMKRIDAEALLFNDRPMALNFFPSGEGTKPQLGIRLSDPVVRNSVWKIAEDSDDMIIRLFEPTGKARHTTVSIPATGASTRIKLGGFEIKTLRLKRRGCRFVDVNLLEEKSGNNG